MGFASRGCSGNTINDEIFVSSDTGISWRKVIFPSIRSDLTVNDFSFFDKNIGAAVYSNNGQLVVTNDGGLTWTLKSGGGIKIKMLSPTRLVTPFFYSSDGGSNWISLVPPFPPVAFNLCIDNMGILYTSSDNSLYVSKDSGLTWMKKSEIWYHDSWSSSAHRSCHDSVIYINNENGIQIGSKTGDCHLYISTDGGQSFGTKFVSNDLILSGTVICGKRGLAYCATFSSIVMTTDYGNTWYDIGGPGGILDVHSFALINDSTLVALDTMGTVWMTTNSNFHPIPKPAVHYPITQGFSLTNISSCDSGKGFIRLQHSFCSPLFILKAEPLGTTSSKFSVKSILVPDTIDQTKTFTVPVNFNPGREVGTFNGGVKIHGFYLDEGDTIFIDTSILFSAKSTPVPPNLIASRFYIPFDTLSTCLPPIDTTVTLTNKGCDTLQIISGPGALASEFSLITPIALPLKLAPDSSITLRFRFKPSGTGFFSTRATFTAEQQTLTQDISINLQGEGEKDVGVLSYSPKKFSFPSISICNHDSASGFVANVGCDSMVLEPTKIFGDPDFKVLGVGGQVLELKPKDTLYYKVYLKPAQKGLRQGYLVLNSNDGVKSRRDTVSFSVTVTDGTRILAASTNALDFGKTTACDEKDSIIHISNKGCDTLEVSGVGGLVSGFGTDTKFPIIILPGHDTIMHVFTILDTSGGKTSNSASLTFNSTSDTTLNPILLTRSYTASIHKNLGLFLDPAVKSGGDQNTVSYDIKESPGKSFTGAGIKQINFDLNYNTNLLDFQASKSTGNLSSADGKSFTISGSPEITADANGILASVGFRVYLTKDSTTTIDLVNARIDTTHAPCTTLAFSGGGSATFDYQFLCGERSISGFMKGVMPMKIISMRPNPAQDEIVVDCRLSIVDGQIHSVPVEIFNALGEKVFSDKKNMTNGTNTIHIDTKGLASGMYLVRVGGSSGEVSKSLVISR